MSSDNNIWMGDIKPWMNESFILNSFKCYNIYPTNVKLIYDRNTNELKNFCFVTFENVEEANKCLLILNGKSIPNTSIKFKLNWASYYSNFNKSVYVGNLSPDVDDLSLYNLFKNKYSSVHHASVITDKGKSRGFGFISFKGGKDYERCLKEMNGIIFHGNVIKVNEQKKKDDDFNENYEKYKLNKNSENNFMERSSLNNNPFKNINQINNSFNYNLQIGNNINNYNLGQNLYINQNEFNQNIINNIININNINNINYINSIYNQNKFNNMIIINNRNKSTNDINLNPINISNLPSSLYIKENETRDNTSNEMININDNDNIKNIKPIRKYIKDNLKVYELEMINKYDSKILQQKIKENLEKMHHYYMDIYPGDINKLKCKFNFIILTFKIVSNMFIYYCNSEKQIKLFSSNINNDTFII